MEEPGRSQESDTTEHACMCDMYIMFSYNINKKYFFFICKEVIRIEPVFCCLAVS